MPVPKITADQFANRLNTGILDRNSSHDVELGPIPDIIVEPSAQVFEQQNDTIRDVSQLILLQEVENYDDIDVDNFVFNEGLIRNEGGRSSGTVIFSRATEPQVDIVVQQNYPIASKPDESTGETVVFVTTESKTMYAASAASYYNLETQRYELEVAVQATVAGQIAEVGPDRINRPLRPLNGFDSVTNRNRSSTATDRETNESLIERYKISILGTQIATRNGMELLITSKFPDAGDVLVVNPEDPLVVRSGEGGNAVDIFINGSQSITRQDSKQFLGIGQLIILDNQPVDSIISVPGYTENVDFELVKDASGVSGSVRAQDAIRFIVGGISPSVGATIQINYNQNLLIENIQNLFGDSDYDIGGQDPLIREATQTDITITATLTVLPGFSFSTIKTAVEASIINYINALGMDDNVERSDLQAIIRAITGVDNFVFSVLDVVGGTGNTDVTIEKNEYARINSGDITIV